MGCAGSAVPPIMWLGRVRVWGALWEQWVRLS